MIKRKDSFFGIHFDFHAMHGQTVGEDCRPEVVAQLLDKTMPDYIQCDTKGHPGLSSYPTKAGIQADKIKVDVLKMWRELTAERNIALYGHYSGLYDFEQIIKHPEWALKDEDGTPSDRYVSVFSPYVDEVMIPQLKELALDYNLNGAWIDGECWSACVDYSDWAMNAYREKFKKEPPKSCDSDYEEYRNFCREGFEAYTQHYIEEVKKVKPDFEVTSNWMYSAYMPGKAKVDVDFLSGDYTPWNSVETARHDSRSLAARNIPWDLMAWGQNSIPPGYTALNRSTKEYEQYCQEASMVISLGGGFQFFNIMYGYGGMVQPWAIPIWEKVAAFCRERQYCHKAEIVHQIGIVYPNQSSPIEKKFLYDKSAEVFGPLCSWNNAILDSGYSTEFIFESEASNLNDYPLIIFPKTASITPESKKLFTDYVKNGGKLIADLGTAKHFLDFADVTQSEEAEKLIFIEGIDALAAAECAFSNFDGDVSTSAYVYETNYFSDKKLPGAVTKKIGKGSITFMCMDFASVYKDNVTSAIKDFIRKVVSETGFSPLAQVCGSTYAELSVTQKDEKLIVNIVNTAGPGGLKHVRGYNEVPKIGPLKIKLNTKKPKRIMRMPENKELTFTYTDGCAEFEFDIVHIHTSAIIEF